MNSVQAWLTLIMAVVIGVLVLLIQSQGKKLHKAQLELLGKVINDRTQANSLAVELAKQQFTKALEAYRKAKERL